MQSLGWGVIGIGNIVQGKVAPVMVADEVVGSSQVVHLEVGSGPRQQLSAVSNAGYLPGGCCWAGPRPGHFPRGALFDNGDHRMPKGR